MSDEFHRKITQLSTEWADADRAANLAEVVEQQFFAKKFLVFKASMGVEESKQAVKADDGYFNVQREAIEARYKADLAKRALKDAELSFERWRTLQANERFTARAGT